MVVYLLFFIFSGYFVIGYIVFTHSLLSNWRLKTNPFTFKVFAATFVAGVLTVFFWLPGKVYYALR